MSTLAAPCRKNGFTLLEILVVLLVMSMLLGLGVGAFSKVGSGPSLAVGHIKSVVRTARFHAVREKAPSMVRVDPESNMIVGMGWKNVGCWHFEDDSEGSSSGFPVDAATGGVGLHEQGVIGRCLDLTLGEDGQRFQVFAPAAPSLDSLDGVALDCFICLKTPGACTVAAKGTAYRLNVEMDGRLRVYLTLAKGKPSLREPGQEVSLDSGAYVVPLNRWIEVGFQFNGYTLSLNAEGIERNREQYKDRRQLYPHHDQPLMIGSGEQPMNGYLDELRLSAAVLGEETPFHESIQLSGKPFNIHFNARGLLDRYYHAHPVEIPFIYAGREELSVTVGLMGEVN